MLIKNALLPTITFITGFFIANIFFSTYEPNTDINIEAETVSLPLEVTPTVKPIKTDVQLELKDNTEFESLLAQNKELTEQLEKLKALLEKRKNNKQEFIANKKELIETKNKLTQAIDHNSELTKKLINYEPELAEKSNSITNEELKKVIPEGIKFYKSIPESRRQHIVDFHKQPEDIDHGYAIQQKITDLILMHENGNDVTIQSLKCKQNQCELFIEDREHETLKSMIDKGYEKTQIKQYMKTYNSAYKPIINSLRQQPDFDFRPQSMMSSTFYGYYLFSVVWNN